MSQNLNPVVPSVYIDGEEIMFESLTLEQSMNSCHRFDVVKEFMSQNEMWSQSPEKLLGYIGSRISIRFEHKSSGEEYEFNGWVTDVCIDAWESQPDYDYYNHKSNRVHIKGSGDAIKLDSSRGNDSFTDTQLKNIVLQSVSSGDVPIQCDPEFDGVLPFMMRFHETIFEFLNRLSSTFNEMFFYDGKTLHFGQPNKNSETLLYFEQDVFSFRTHACALPKKVEAYDYQYEKDTTDYMSGSGKQTSSLLGKVTKCAERLFEDSELTVSGAHLTDSGCLKKYVDAKQTSAEGAMLTVEGETRTCRLSLGSIVEILFPSKMNVNSLGRYRVQSITHRVDKTGNYSNHFTATPEGKEYVSQKYLGTVQAFPQMATVVDNEDSMGRVRVQFDWQGALAKTTNWIPVQSPDAGGSGVKNRGLVFIPEIGDRVMVGFEYGDPSRPYVVGSMFSGTTGNGGGSGNNIHSIVTKSGHQIKLTDSGDWSIVISDKNGNVLKLDTASKSILVSSAEKISMISKEIEISADNNLTLTSGKRTQHSIGEDYVLSVGGMQTVDVKKNIKVSTDDALNVKIEKDVNLNINGDYNAISKGDTTIKSNGELDVVAQSDLNLKSGYKINVAN